MTPTRSLAPDVLRGFALLGIIAVNAPFFAAPIGEPPGVGTIADGLAAWAVAAFGMGKFFLVFSFLFGFGFSVLMSRPGAPDGPFIRRLLGLFSLGAAHAVLLFGGDILALYAVVGLALWLLRKQSDRSLLALAVLALLGSLGSQVLVLTAPLADEVAPAVGPGYLGSFWDAALRRIADLPLAVTIVGFFNGPPAFAMFLLGYVASRRGLFPMRAEQLRRVRKPGAVALAVSVVGSGLASAAYVNAEAGGPSKLAGAIGLSLFAPVLAFAIVVVVCAFATRRPDGALTRTLALVGRNTLSGYLLHSLLLGAVFFGWGLGRYGSLSAAEVQTVALATYATIALLLHAWHRWFHVGPAEWLLRAFTYGRARPSWSPTHLPRPG